MKVVKVVGLPAGRQVVGCDGCDCYGCLYSFIYHLVTCILVLESIK